MNRFNRWRKAGANAYGATNQHTDAQSYRVKIDLENLPANLRGRPLRKRMFRIDDRTSND